MIPQSFIQDLLARVDIVEVVGRYVQLKKAGQNHVGLCPFHAEKSPSFTVSSIEAVFSLLWVRRAWQRHRIFDGAPRPRLRRCDT